MEVDDTNMLRSVEEDDLLARSVKKHKRPAVGEPGSPSSALNEARVGWAELLRSTVNPPLEIYTGEGEDDDTTLDLLEGYDTATMVDSEGVESGRVTIDIPLEECKRLWTPWRRALVIKVLGKNFSFRILEKRVTDLWGLGNSVNIVDLNRGFFVVRFYSAAQYHNALENGPWMIQGHYITVSKWRPFLSTKSEVVEKTLTWVRVPDLPLEFFHEGMLMRLGNLLGRAVKADTTSLKVQRGKYARVCVEVDLRQQLVSRIQLNGQLFEVEYEGLNLICFKCGKYGHKTEDCGKKGECVEGDTKEAEGSGVENRQLEAFGPWMIASNSRRKRVVQQYGRRQESVGIGVETLGEKYKAFDVFQGDTISGMEKQRRGSRFAPLGPEGVEDVSEAEEDDLHDQLVNIVDKGPSVSFKVTTKESMKKKGIHVKESQRARVQPRNQRNFEVGMVEEETRGQRVARTGGRGSSFRGRGALSKGRGGGGNFRHLQDITNQEKLMALGGIHSGNLDSDWPSLTQYKVAATSMINREHIKHHPPDLEKGGDGSHIETIEPRNMRDGSNNDEFVGQHSFNDDVEGSRSRPDGVNVGSEFLPRS